MQYKPTKRLAFGIRPGWWVHAIAKPSGNQSCVGPFQDPIAAGQFVVENRPDMYWRNISINLRQGKKR